MPFDPQTQIKLPGFGAPLKISEIVAAKMTTSGLLKEVFLLRQAAYLAARGCNGGACHQGGAYIEERFGINSKDMFGRHARHLGRVHFSWVDRAGFIDGGENLYMNPEHIVAGYDNGKGQELIFMRGGLTLFHTPMISANDNANAELLSYLPFMPVMAKGTFDIAGSFFTGQFFVNPHYWDERNGEVVVNTNTIGYPQKFDEPVPVYSHYKNAEYHHPHQALLG